MPEHEQAWLRGQREYWLRPDGAHWVRPDAARFLIPGTKAADVFPALARKRDAKDVAITAELRQLVELRDELTSIKAELTRRRSKERKYSPSQPRLPAGNPRGGQWTDRGDGQGIGVGLSQDIDLSPDASLALPLGNIDFGDVSGSSELGDLFKITPDDTRVSGVQLAGDLPNGLGGLRNEPPEIPTKMPETTGERMGFVRRAAQWLNRVGRYSPIADAFLAQQIRWKRSIA